MRTARMATEAMLDGIYVIRTSVPTTKLSAAEAVRRYKSLSQVERAFRSLKTMDLHVRPIHHRLADRVRSHIFLCMLAYYVEWHMREVWRPLLFADEDQRAKATRDPVAPAKRSPPPTRKPRPVSSPTGRPSIASGRCCTISAASCAMTAGPAATRTPVPRQYVSAHVAG